MWQLCQRVNTYTHTQAISVGVETGELLVVNIIKYFKFKTDFF